MLDDQINEDDTEAEQINEKTVFVDKPVDARRRIEQLQEERRLRKLLEEDWPEQEA